MSIEKLTKEERECLVLQDGDVTGSNARKALRIIDAHAAALAESLAECERLRELLDIIDAQAAVLTEARAECERLRAANVTLTTDCVRCESAQAAAESKLAAAEAECERLREKNANVLESRLQFADALSAAEADCLRLRANWTAAESKLAAAQALLGRVKARENGIWDEDLVADITAHLDGAAAPRVGGDAEALIALAERERDEARAEWKRLATFVARQAPARTEAEQQYVVQGRETVINAATGRGVCQAYSNEYAIQIAAALNAAPARPAAPKKDEGAK
jgi:DNA polymerase IIIc chi subunit